MSEDNMPIEPADNSHRLPTTGGTGRDVAPRPQWNPLSAELSDGKPHEDSDEIDLRALWRILLKRRWLILGVVSAVVALALIHTLMTPSVYRATSVIEINQDSAQVMPSQMESMQQNYYYDPNFQETQIQLLKGRALSQRVAENLHLVNSGILNRLAPPSWLQRVRGLLSPGAHAAEQPVTNKPSGGMAATGSGAVNDGKSAQDGRDADDNLAKLRNMTSLIQGGLVIDPIRGSNLVNIHYDSTSPQFSATVANALANGFIAASMDRQFGASSYAKKYLSDQLSQLRSRLEESERELVAFAQKEQIVPTTNGQSLAGQNLTDLNSSLAAAQNARIQAQARWEEAKAVTGAALPADMLTDPVLQALQQQRANLMSQYQDKLQTFKPDYPSMRALRSQMNEVQKQIGQELTSIRASVKAEYDAAASRETMLEAQLETLRGKTLNVEGRSIHYNILKRNVDTNRELYKALLQRFKAVSAASGIRPSNIAVIDLAEPPMSRYSPSLSRNIELGLVIGIMLGVLLAWLLERLDDTLKTPSDIETRLHLALLGIVPKLVKQTPAEAIEDPRSAFSESYRSVRTALQFSTEGGVPNVLLITSPGEDEGKSTTALTLARNFAQLGKRVLLIEGDLRNPSLGKTMRLVPSVGLSSLLAGAATLAEVLLPTGEPNLEVILAGALPPSPTELLAGYKLVSLLLTGTQKYDQIIIDGPPVLGIADAPILANAAAGTLLITQAGSTRISAAQMAIKRLHAARAHIIGGLLTQYDARAGDYGYYGGYYAYGGNPRLSEE